MERPQLEHIIRAASAITGADKLVVIGSQAVLGQFPDAPAELLVSVEADVFTFRGPQDSDQTFGYYAHGVGEETAVLPTGWKERLVTIQSENTGAGIGLCLEVHDLAVSKLIAAREKDLDFISALFRHRLVNVYTIRDRLRVTPITDQQRDSCLARLSRLAKAK